MKFILGKKLKMTQIFKNDTVVPVTLIEAGPCVVTQIKVPEKDGYSAVQIGYQMLKEGKVKKTQKGKPYRYLKEFRVKELNELKPGQKIDASIFQEGDKVKVSATSKGKGFQGAVKRWGFSGRDRTHGVKHEHRTLGSVGASGPERVFKGKKMPGHTGSQRVTIKNLEVVKVDPKNNILGIKGAIPGARGTLVEIVTI